MPVKAWNICSQGFCIRALDATPELGRMKKFSFRFRLKNQRWARFAQLGMPVSVMVMHCQMQCMAKPDATPKCYNLLWWKNFLFDSAWGIRGRLDLRNSGCPWVHVHALSDGAYGKAWCDTQAFQLALMKKFSFRFWLRNQRSARFAQLWMPVSAMVMHCQMERMAKPDATPKHFNLVWWKNFVNRKYIGCNEEADCVNYNFLSKQGKFAVRNGASGLSLRYPSVWTWHLTISLILCLLLHFEAWWVFLSFVSDYSALCSLCVYCLLIWSFSLLFF